MSRKCYVAISLQVQLTLAVLKVRSVWLQAFATPWISLLFADFLYKKNGFPPGRVGFANQIILGHLFVSLKDLLSSESWFSRGCAKIATPSRIVPCSTCFISPPDQIGCHDRLPMGASETKAC